ncbi:MAG: hypothetical protein M0R30_03250 [Methanoregula sp.]|jgi:hypothetical protein|uniref:hypothetical protein n=1 Tax=Methanoregula sp. TaxID=2052170 RepID=UPI0025D150F5|nr:hypothetical protein [Methanoregula sp.]MCK9630638.1 hypothetical protein [Methanoregula sp.]
MKWGRTEIILAFIGDAVLFLPLFVFLRVRQDPQEEENEYAFFVFLPKLIQREMLADANAASKN